MSKDKSGNRFYGQNNKFFDSITINSKPRLTDDEIDIQCKKIASQLSNKSWTVTYGGSPLQTKHFSVHKGSGRSFEYHPMMPKAKSNFQPNGWHIDNLDELIKIIQEKS